MLRAAGAADARVLHLEGAEGVFGGFEDQVKRHGACLAYRRLLTFAPVVAAQAKGDEFERMVKTWLLGGWSATWCCTSWEKMRGTLMFKRPLKLPSGAAARAEASASRQPEVPAERACYGGACADCGRACGPADHLVGT